jgi:hypothetical protein
VSATVLRFGAPAKRQTLRDAGRKAKGLFEAAGCWFPRWLDGRRPKKTAYAYVDRIDFVAQPK